MNLIRSLQARQRFVPLLVLALIAGWLRLANLGYSDYQGDEIKALKLPVAGQSLWDFLLEQRKGPLQFIITFLIQLVHPSLANEFIVRLPFALAGVVGVYLFFKLAERRFGTKIALYAAWLLAVNGLFVGLTRIVQYQSLVVLFSLLALNCFSLAVETQTFRISGLYAGMLFWVAAILSHYDGIFIAPLAIYLLIFQSRRKAFSNPVWRKHLVIATSLAVLFLGLFFVPFLFGLRDSTLQYWWGRLAGEEQVAGLPSSLVTFRLYNPLLALPIYTFFGVWSLIRLRMAGTGPTTGSTAGLNAEVAALWGWFLFPWLCLEVLIADPGTHIYAYLLPACLLVALGFDTLERFVRRWLTSKGTLWAGVTVFVVLGLSLGAVSHLIFVDHTPEYPWEPRRILFWTVGQPDATYRLWVFGFPYRRQWEEIGAYVTSGEESEYYATNENKSIAGFYVPYPFDINRAGYYIHIYHPQSFRDRLADDKIRYWMKNYPPIKTFSSEGKVIAEIYLMPAGDTAELRRQGY